MSAEYFYDIEQNSPEWDEMRAGLVTSSEIGTVLASGRGSAPSKTRRKYMLNLIADRLGAAPSDRYVSAQMERGHAMEQEAADAYALLTDDDPQLIGFVRNGETGASPDRLIGDNGLLEIKTKDRHRQLECLLQEGIPAEHLPQLYGQLWICEREWVDFCSYWPGIKPVIRRLYRNDKEIARIKEGVDKFLDELHGLMERVKAA